MPRYKILEKIATADIAFEAYGKDLNELFENSAFAVFEITANIKKINSKIKKIIKIENDNVEDLLFDFLSELIFLKDKDYMVFNKSKIKINKNQKYKLNAQVFGEKISQKKHDLKLDIKAITLHMFKVEKTKQGYKALVVVDV